VNFSSTTHPPPALLGMGELMSGLEGKMERLLRQDSGGETAEGGAVSAALYHLGSGGRRIRGRLALHASLSLGLSSADALILAAVVEFLHNASLVHDDLQDDEMLRHGVPTVGVVFGTNTAICAGDLLLSAAYAALGAISGEKLLPKRIALVHAATATAIRGQCAGFPGPDGLTMDAARYREVATAKSGALLSLPMELSFLAANRTEWIPQARRAAEEFAVGYQIMDDVQDAASDGPLAVNLVSILKASGHGENASASAHAMGQRHLRNAAELAGALPDGAGDLLANLATALCRQPAAE